MIEILPVNIEDASRLISIYEQLNIGLVTNEEANYLLQLANNKHYPIAEYLVAYMYFFGKGVDKNKVIALKYLDACSKHAGYGLQVKIAQIHYLIGDHTKTRKCLRRALRDLGMFRLH